MRLLVVDRNSDIGGQRSPSVPPPDALEPLFCARARLLCNTSPPERPRVAGQPPSSSAPGSSPRPAARLFLGGDHPLTTSTWSGRNRRKRMRTPCGPPADVLLCVQ